MKKNLQKGRSREGRAREGNPQGGENAGFCRIYFCPLLRGFPLKISEYRQKRLFKNAHVCNVNDTVFIEVGSFHI